MRKKIIGVIPARFNSSRLPGKPLADICGKPMVWWVYQQAKKAQYLSEVYVATDHQDIFDFCLKNKIPAVMTEQNHETHLDRIYEFSNKVNADLYVVICGDEPIIEEQVINEIVRSIDWKQKIIVSGARRLIENLVELTDTSNIKIITNKYEYCLALSRLPIPYSYKGLDIDYFKTIGIECFNKKALEIISTSKKQSWEIAEDIMMLRFLEKNIPVKFKLVTSNSLSIDTEKDLEFVRNLISKKEK